MDSFIIIALLLSGVFALIYVIGRYNTQVVAYSTATTDFSDAEALYATYYINLDRETGRDQVMTQMLASHKLSATRVSGVLGTAISDVSDIYDRDGSMARNNRELTPGELGCTMSHRSTWQRHMDGDQTYSVVLESDARLKCTKKELNRIILELDKLDVHWSICLLFNDSSATEVQPLTSKFDSLPQGSSRTHAYIINDKGSAALLAEVIPIVAAADGYFSDMAVKYTHFMIRTRETFIDYDHQLETTILGR